MSRLLRIVSLTLVALSIASLAVAWIWRDEISRLRAVVTLFEPDRIVANFSAMDAAFLTAPIPLNGAPMTPLPPGPRLLLPADAVRWVESASVTGLVVLRGPGVVFEQTYLGTGLDDRRISWSVAKSILSVLVGTAVDRGEISDLDAPVTDYVPELTGGAYDGVTVRQVLQMTSGVRFDEDYLDFWSDINRMGRVLALGREMDAFAAGVTERDRAPGLAWHYVSIDTHVVGMVLRAATGRSLPELMAERVMQPLGLETEPFYLTDGAGVAFVLGGLNMALRDYARFGQMIAQEGRLGEHQVVSSDWLDESLSPSAPTAPGQDRYGYQWWMPPDMRLGEVYAKGLYGQYIYIDRVRDIVIAATGANLRFLEDGEQERAIQAFRLIADATETLP